MSQLHVIIGQGTTYIDAIQDAVDRYNQLDGSKVFHAKDVIQFQNTFLCEVWFTFYIATPAVAQDSNVFIGMRANPMDPHWKTFIQNTEQPQEEELQEREVHALA